MYSRKAKAFTLIELVVVILIIALVAGVILKPKSNSVQYWQQENAIRKITEQINFLYHQALSDGLSYQIQFHFGEDRHYYLIRELQKPVQDISELGNISNPGSQITSRKIIAEEIDNFLNPLPADFGEFQAPTNIPSLAEPVYLPEGMYFRDIRTVRGDYLTSSEENFPYLNFSPRGYAEFTVIHLTLKRDTDLDLTILVNPFTGIADLYREYKQFEWKYSSSNE